jgi:twitching motility two-component system response regulator PilH
MAFRKVMVVDDAQADRMNLEKIIAGAGFQVITAISGEQAVDKAKAEKPDIIFMDVNMKEVDGFQATRSLQNDPATKGIPVVFVTSKNQQADQVWAKMLGAKGYVTKPYSPDQILEQLK